MATVGYVHFSIGPQEIAAATARLAAAGADRVVVEHKPPAGSPPIVVVPPGYEALKKQPALIELIRSLGSGDTLMATRLYLLAPAILRLLCVAQNARNLGIDLVSLDDDLDTRDPGGDRIFAAFDGLGSLVQDFLARHNHHTLHIMEGNGGDGGGGGGP